MRRSTRISIPNNRSLQFSCHTRSNHRTLSPSSCDEIKVKWIVDDKPFWWPETVLNIDSTDARDRLTRTAEVKYHHCMRYKSELSTVKFFIDQKTFDMYLYELRSKKRNSQVDAICQSEVCSWIFSNESLPEDNFINNSSVQPGPTPFAVRDITITRPTVNLSISSNTTTVIGKKTRKS